MIENKVLLPWHDGEPIVRHVASRFLAASIEKIFVVTGRDAAQVRAALADRNVTCVHNPDFETGEMLSSVKVGLRALPDGLAASFIQPADMPCVPIEVIAQLAAAYETGWNVAPQFEGRRGHPVLLDRAYWRAMLDLPPEAKPRVVIEAAREQLRLVDVSDEGVLLDIDTRKSYERAMGIASKD
jgi:molybdenum cofactor cytidylyltransferase